MHTKTSTPPDTSNLKTLSSTSYDNGANKQKPEKSSEIKAVSSKHKEKKDHSQFFLRLGQLVGSLLIAVVLIYLFGLSPTLDNNLVKLVLVFGLLGIFPLSYLVYKEFASDTRREMLREDFRLLGLVSENDLDATLNYMYRYVYSSLQFWVYICLIIIISLLVFIGYFNRGAVDPENYRVITLIFFSYLGAYTFSVIELVRRYNTFDLQPQVYTSILIRILVAGVVAFVFAKVILMGGGQLFNPSGSNNETGWEAWVIIVTFIVGVFPNLGIRWLIQQANRIFNPPSSQSSELPLRALQGMNSWHEARLAMMGIDDSQNLATAFIPKLLLTTQFDAEQIVNWIDQAILHVKVGAKIDRFREAKINTFHELQRVAIELSDHTTDNGKDTKSPLLVTLLGLTGLDELDRLTDHTGFPNFDYVCHYYEYKPQVGTQRSETAVQELTGLAQFAKAGVTDRRRSWDSSSCMKQPKDLQEKINNLLIRKKGASRNTCVLIHLGEAYFQKGDLSEALKYFDEALQINSNLTEAYYLRSFVHLKLSEDEKNKEIEKAKGDAMRDLTRAIQIDPTYSPAYHARGSLYLKQEYLYCARKDLDRAIQLDPQLAVAYLDRGILFNNQSKFEDALKEFEKAYLLGYNQSGLSLAWGLAFIGFGEYQQAEEKLSEAIRFEPERVDARVHRGNAYFQLNPPQYYREARLDLEFVIKSLETEVKSNENKEILSSAYANLGLLEAREGNYEKALENYEKALEKGPATLVIYDNMAAMAIAKGQDRLLQKVRAVFLKAQALVPEGSPMYLKIQDYLDVLPDSQDEIDAMDEVALQTTLEDYQETLKKHESQDDKVGMITTLWKIAQLYTDLERLKEALQAYQKSLKLAEEQGIKENIFVAKMGIGNTQTLLQNYNEALKAYKESLKLADDKSKQLRVHWNLGNILVKLKQYEESLTHFKEALHLAEQENNIRGEADSHRGIGLVYEKIDQLPKASQHLEQASRLYRQLGEEVAQTVIEQIKQDLARIEKRA